MSELKRVLIDARMVAPRLHGIARYVVMLARALRELKEKAVLGYEPVFIVQKDSKDAISEFFEPFETVFSKSPFLSPRAWLEIPWFVRRSGADLYHSPSFESFVGIPVPWVMTLHDLNHLRFGNWLQKQYYGFGVKPFARKAAAVCVVSEFARQEVSKWLGSGKSDLHLTTNAIDPEFCTEIPAAEVERVLSQYALQEKGYFFCFSNSKPFKNAKMLIRAHSAAWKSAAGARFPLVSNLPEGKAGPGVQSLGPLDEADLRVLVRSARTVFFPSLYEGFGLPPVEAVAAGVPVVASRIPPHLESLGELEGRGVVFLDPKDAGAWREEFFRRMSEVPPEISAEDRARVCKRFSTQVLGEQVDRVYRRVLGLSP